MIFGDIGCRQCRESTAGVCARHSVPMYSVPYQVPAPWICPRCNTMNAPTQPVCGNLKCGEDQ
jgi:hypothetical protein